AGRAPSPVLNVVRRKTPSLPVRRVAGWPPSSWGRKVTVAPARALPSRVTIPSTLDVRPLQPPASAASTKAPARRLNRKPCLYIVTAPLPQVLERLTTNEIAVREISARSARLPGPIPESNGLCGQC